VIVFNEVIDEVDLFFMISDCDLFVGRGARVGLKKDQLLLD